MGVRVKDEGQFKEIYVKALDSMPVGTIVDYDGQTSDIPTGWETYGTGQIKKTSETRPLASHTVNAYSESESNAYSCDYINKCNTYSTSEVFTGKYFKDGKPIYRITFYQSNYTQATNFNISISALNIDKLVLPPYGMTYDGTMQIPIPFANQSNEVNYAFKNGNNIACYLMYGTSADITLEYTKTTDTSQSTRSSNTYSGDIEEKKDIVIDDGEEEKPIDEGNDENNK